MAWNEALNGKDLGGLGIGSLKALNLALLKKWWWRFRTENNSLWKEVVSSCHGCSGGLMSGDRVRTKPECGQLSRVYEKSLKKQIFILIIFGDGISFIHDGSGPWIKTVRIRLLLCGMQLIGIYLRLQPRLHFGINWVPSKINIHMWRLHRNRLPTKENLIRRGIHVGSRECSCCVSFPEDADHLFVNYSTTRVVGTLVKNRWCDWPTATGSVNDLWTAMQSNSDHPGLKKIGEVIGMSYFWVLWKQRNDILFNRKWTGGKELVNAIQYHAFLWHKCRVKGGNLTCWDDWLKSPLTAVNSFSLASH